MLVWFKYIPYNTFISVSKSEFQSDAVPTLALHWANCSRVCGIPLLTLIGLRYLLTFVTRLYLNRLTAKLFNLNFHPLEIVSR